MTNKGLGLGLGLALLGFDLALRGEGVVGGEELGLLLGLGFDNLDTGEGLGGDNWGF